MRKAREVWKLKMDGANAKKIASDLSISSNVINNIIQYTTSDYYNPLMKKPSYYDEQLALNQKIILGKKKTLKIINAIKYKKKLFLIILEATVVMILLLIVT